MEKRFTIRQMRPEDCEQVAYIDSLCIHNPWSQKDFLELFQYSENHYLVAEYNQRIIGFVGLIQFVDDGDITHIAVLEEYRGMRVATALMKWLFQLAVEMDMIAIHLEVRQHNEIAKQFYYKLGFEELAIRRNYYTNPVEDAIVMVKHL